MLPAVAAMEAASYPADEMASAETLAYRLEHAGPFFKVVLSDEGAGSAAPRVLGFVVGTLSVARELHHQAMFEHAPQGQYFCIHSVVTDASLRRRGLARAMLREYVSQVRQEQGAALKAMVLICKQPLVPLYQSCGFELVGPSAVVHGQDPWFECRLTLEKELKDSGATKA